jgi:tetratricopeptide (TPR) repeat protein
VWREKLAFVVPALGIVPLAVLARVGSGDLFRREHYDPLAGAAVALYGAAFYLRRTVLVGESAALYEAPPGWTPLDWPFVASGVLVLLLSGLCLAARRRWPGPLAAWLAYGVLLAPLSGLLPLGLLHLAADRYSYVTCVSWAVLAGAGALAGGRAWRRGHVATPVAALSLGLVVLALAGWGALSSIRVGIWRDGKTLWAHTVSVAPGSAVGQNNLGEALEAEGDLAGAVEHYREAARLWPSHAPFFVNLGRTLARQGRLAEATLALRAAIRLRPAAAEGHVALGVVRSGRPAGRGGRGVPDGAGIEPGSAVTHYNLGVALEKQERTADAVEEYRRTLELDPGLAAARVRLEAALRRLPPGQGGPPR